MVDPKVDDAYAGRCRIGPDEYLSVTREGDRLMVHPSGQPELEIHTESETEFFLKVVDASLTFVKDDQGKVTDVRFRLGKSEQRAKRVDPDVPGPREEEMTRRNIAMC